MSRIGLSRNRSGGTNTGTKTGGICGMSRIGRCSIGVMRFGWRTSILYRPASMSRTSSDPSRNGLRSRTCPVDWFVSRTVASRLAGVYPWSWMFREPVARFAITRLSHQPLEVAVRKADLPEHRQVVVRPLLDGGKGHPVVELRGGAVAGEEAGLADDADCRGVGQGALDPDLDHSTDRIHRERERLGR